MLKQNKKLFDELEKKVCEKCKKEEVFEEQIDDEDEMDGLE